MAPRRGKDESTNEFSLDVPETKVVRYDASATEALARGELRTMVEFARQSPRDMPRCLNDFRVMATQNDDVAASCYYTLPRKDKEITGPSIRFAELLFASMPHLHADEAFIQEEPKFIVVRCSVYDCQMNRGAARVVRRRITDKAGNRYNEDMIAVTTQAAFSIGFRNAVLRVIPPALWGLVFTEVLDMAVGGKDKLHAVRDRAIEWFAAEGGITAERLFKFLNVASRDELGLKHVRMLRGMATGLREGNLRWSIFDREERARGADAVPVVPDPDNPSDHEQQVLGVFEGKA